MFKKRADVQVTHVVTEAEFNKRVADKKIVQFDPEFVYVAARALTADKPNANADAFSHQELSRVDPVLRRPVYASFISKGVYVSHKADDPTIAKGVILDSRYVTADENDRYVELLLGIDRHKDPAFAKGVENGTISRWSMGCSCRMARCSICDNRAYSKADFCEHIARYKGKEVQTKTGQKKLAFEWCEGVSFSELSAVADPADETAQTLARIANKSGAPDSTIPGHQTVATVRNLAKRVTDLESEKQEKTMKTATKTAPKGAPKTARNRVAMPPAASPMDDPSLGGEDPLAGDGMDEGPDEGAPESELSTVLHTITDLADGQISPEEAVQSLQEAGLGGGEEEFDDGFGAPEDGMDAGGAPGGGFGGPGAASGKPMMARRTPAGRPATAKARPAGTRIGGVPSFGEYLKFVAAQKARSVGTSGGGRAAARPRVAAEGASEKIPGQYPDYKVQKDPAQHKATPQKGRPSSDFSQSKKELADLQNIKAEFIADVDARKSVWRVSDGETPLYDVNGVRAFRDAFPRESKRFASEQYGMQLVKSILDNGLEPTMNAVKATKVDSEALRTAASDEAKAERWAKAAEAKAVAMAQELVAEHVQDWKERLMDGVKVALQLQAKNVLDSPIKAAAFEVFASHGLDGTLAELVADPIVVEAHFDAAMNKALEYCDMAPESFEEVKAYVQSLPMTRVAGETEADTEERQAEAQIAQLRARAGKNLHLKVASVEPGKEFDDRIAAAVRSGSTLVHRRTPVPMAIGRRGKR